MGWPDNKLGSVKMLKLGLHKGIRHKEKGSIDECSQKWGGGGGGGEK